MHINELKFSLHGGAAEYQPSRQAEQSYQYQQQQPVVKLLLVAYMYWQSSDSRFRQSLRASCHVVPVVPRRFNKLKHSYL